jgi:hypothetical protein
MGALVVTCFFHFCVHYVWIDPLKFGYTKFHYAYICNVIMLKPMYLPSNLRDMRNCFTTADYFILVIELNLKQSASICQISIKLTRRPISKYPLDDKSSLRHRSKYFTHLLNLWLCTSSNVDLRIIIVLRKSMNCLHRGTKYER